MDFGVSNRAYLTIIGYCDKIKRISTSLSKIPARVKNSV